MKNRGCGNGRFPLAVGALIAFVLSVVSVSGSHAQSLTPVSQDSLPSAGTFWLGSGGAPLPFFPYAGLDVQVYSMDGSSDVFLIDDSELAALEAEFNEMMEESEGGDWVAESFIHFTNDLWLEITAFTNSTAALVIHKPWNDTSVAHDLFYTTNLSWPINWGFVKRCVSTNVVVPELCNREGFFMLGQTNGALTVTTNVTANQMAQLLVPPWVTVSNATYTGSSVARGLFAGGNGCGLPIESGVILSSGWITNAIGPNSDSGQLAQDYGSDLGTGGDTVLDSLVGGSGTSDAAVLEFDVITSSNAVIAFEYIFASEEYPEWLGGSGGFNDLMAIFVSTNYNGTNWIITASNNIALVPGTNLPVSVNTINGGGYNINIGEIPPTNPQYYVDNADPMNTTNAPAFNVQFDGMTVVLTPQVQISPGIRHHIKIPIADYSDHHYDSGVFIKARSSCQCR